MTWSYINNSNLPLFFLISNSALLILNTSNRILNTQNAQAQSTKNQLIIVIIDWLIKIKKYKKVQSSKEKN